MITSREATRVTDRQPAPGAIIPTGIVLRIRLQERAETRVPTSNYSGSFGDNYAIGNLTPVQNPWESYPYPPTIVVPGQPRIGWPGFWGTAFDDAIVNRGPGQLTRLFLLSHPASRTRASCVDH